MRRQHPRLDEWRQQYAQHAERAAARRGTRIDEHGQHASEQLSRVLRQARLPREQLVKPAERVGTYVRAVVLELHHQLGHGQIAVRRRATLDDSLRLLGQSDRLDLDGRVGRVSRCQLLLSELLLLLLEVATGAGLGLGHCVVRTAAQVWEGGTASGPSGLRLYNMRWISGLYHGQY